VIDATRGLVIEHKMHFDITKPTVIKARKRDPIPNIVAEIKIDMERKLEELEKE
jgi:hypothetical protein